MSLAPPAISTLAPSLAIRADAPSLAIQNPMAQDHYYKRAKRLQRLRYDPIDGALLYCLRYHMRRPQRIPIIKTGSGRSRYKTTSHYMNASFAVALGRRQRRRLCRRHRRAINAIDIVASIFSISAPSQHSSE